MFANFFIHRRAFAVVISIVIMLIGALAIFSLPIARYPQITPPTVQVETTYIGASAEVVEQSVATAIEAEVNGVENMIYMTSRSSGDGRYVLTCTFEVGTNLDLAAVDVQNRVSRAQGDLPNEVNTYGISVEKRSPDMLMVLSVYSPDRTHDELFLLLFRLTALGSRCVRLEWNGTMLHANTAVVDGHWARFGWTNLNIASWLGIELLYRSYTLHREGKRDRGALRGPAMSR